MKVLKPYALACNSSFTHLLQIRQNGPDSNNTKKYKTK